MEARKARDNDIKKHGQAFSIGQSCNGNMSINRTGLEAICNKTKMELGAWWMVQLIRIDGWKNCLP